MSQQPDSGLKALIGQKFLGKSGDNDKKLLEKSFSEVVSDSDLIGLYFSAHWCPPCRAFTPKLSEYYTKWKKDGKKIVIIFGSSDKDKTSFESYYNEMANWFAFNFGDENINKLKKKYSVSGIPWLVILDKNGKLIQNEADTEVGKSGEKAVDTWLSKI